MSRSGYSYDLDQRYLALWRGAVASAIRGKRGQTMLRELRDALDAMPEKKLIAHELVRADGAICVLGALGQQRGLDMDGLDPEDSDAVAAKFGIAGALAQEIVFENDESQMYRDPETPEHRWTRMRAWVDSHITVPA